MMVLNFDVVLASSLDKSHSNFQIVKSDRLTVDEAIELDFSGIVKLTKSFLQNNEIVSNSIDLGIPDDVNKKLVDFMNLADVSRADYEGILTGLRYNDLYLFVIARTDLDIAVEDDTEFDVRSYVLDGLLENTPGTSNYFIGQAKNYLNEGEGLYPYAIDFVDQLGLSDEDRENYDVNAALSNYNALKEMQELGSFDDSYARNLIESMGMKFYRFRAI